MLRGKLLIARQASGIGDWLMVGSVIKMVNHQYPMIKVDVSTFKATTFIKSLMDSLDIAFEWVDVHPLNGPFTGYTYKTEHIVYQNHHKFQNRHFIDGMVENFNIGSGLSLQYEPGVFAEAKIGESVAVPKLPFVLMPSQGRDSYADCREKEWGTDNFAELSRLLSKRFKIVQIGAESDTNLANADFRYKGCEAQTIAWLMSKCRFYIGIVNGLCVLAGQNGIKSYIVYCGGQESPFYSAFPNQFPITISNASPAEVCDMVFRNEGFKR